MVTQSKRSTQGNVETCLRNLWFHMGVSQNGLQYTMIPSIKTPKKGPRIFGNPHLDQLSRPSASQYLGDSELGASDRFLPVPTETMTTLGFESGETWMNGHCATSVQNSKARLQGLKTFRLKQKDGPYLQGRASQIS